MRLTHAFTFGSALGLLACHHAQDTADGTASDARADAAETHDVALSDAQPTDLGAPLDAPAQTATFTFTPAAIPASDPELPDPMRGQYRWLGSAPVPAGWPENDSYQRWEWQSFEPTRGAYQWSMIDNELAAARARNGRFGMRLMALCQGCATHTYMGAHSSIPDDLAAVANPLIASAPGDPTTERYVLPDWNSDAYLSRLQTLLSAIGTRYHDDPHFAFVDVTGYGNWGEFHLWPFSTAGGPYDHSTQRPITDANARRVVQMNAAAFANKLLVVNSEQRAALAEAVATESPPVGIRVDCLGADGLGGGQDPLTAVPGALERWRTAPFVTEWCQYNIGSSGANLFVQGETQVRTYHISMLSSGNFNNTPSTTAEVTAFRAANVESGYRLRAASVAVTVAPGTLTVRAQWVDDNVAPTYLHWRVIVGMRGPAQIEQPLAVDLRTVQPDMPVDSTDTLHSVSMPSGHYDFYLRVEDVQGVSPPMNLAMQGRNAAGEYVLGGVDVP